MATSAKISADILSVGFVVADSLSWPSILPAPHILLIVIISLWYLSHCTIIHYRNQLCDRTHNRLTSPAYAAHTLPIEIFLLAMLLGEHKEVMRLRRVAGDILEIDRAVDCKK
jgi:hypothetical protein